VPVPVADAAAPLETVRVLVPVPVPVLVADTAATGLGDAAGLEGDTAAVGDLEVVLVDVKVGGSEPAGRLEPVCVGVPVAEPVWLAVADDVAELEPVDDDVGVSDGVSSGEPPPPPPPPPPDVPVVVAVADADPPPPPPDVPVADEDSANSVSPTIATLASGHQRVMEPGEWPGVWRMRK
jgi:hypothetical protein